MYPETYLKQVDTQRKAMIRNAVIILMVSLIASIFTGIYVRSLAGLILLCLGICVFIAYWGLRGSQVSAYYHFVLDITFGRHREIEAEVVRVSTAPAYKDNKVYYYEIETMQEDVNRLLLWDANFPLPDIQAGQRVRFSVMDKYIWDIEHPGR